MANQGQQVIVLDAATRAAITAAVVAGMQATAAQLPAPVVNIARGASKNDVALPRKYSGGEDFQEFLQEVRLYLASNADVYHDDNRKVAFMLSYLQGGRAEAWKVQYQLTHTSAANVLTLPSLAVFTTDLTTTFDDPNLVEKSYRRFEELRQGSSTADEFFSLFDIYRTRAKLVGASVEVVLLNQLKKALNPRVFMGVMRSSPIPTTYAAWRTKAIEVDRTEQQLDHTMQSRRQARAALPPPPTRPNINNPFRFGTTANQQVPRAAPAPAPQVRPWVPQIPRPQVPTHQAPRAPPANGPGLAIPGHLLSDIQGARPA